MSIGAVQFRDAAMSHTHRMENVTLTPERTDESPGFEQPASGADCIGSGGRVDGSVSTRHARRITDRLPGSEGAAALAHGHRGRRPVNATSEAVIADVVHLGQH